MSALHRMVQTEFRKNVFTLIGGSVIAQLIPLLLYPVLSRIFTPAEYGLFALFYGIVSVAEVIATGRYELAVVLPANDNDSASLIAGGVSLALVFSTILLLLVILIPDEITSLFGNPGLAKWLMLIPLWVFITSATKMLNAFLTRKKAFKAFIVNKMVFRVFEGGFAFSLGKMKWTNGLLIGDLVGRFSMMLVSWMQTLKAGLSFQKTDFAGVRKNLWRYREFPLYNSVPAVLNCLSSLLPVFILSAAYCEADTGFFNFSRTLLAAPIALISANISQVLFQQIAEKRNKRLPISQDIRKLLIQLIVVTLIPAVVVIIWAVPIFSFVFGETWAVSGSFTRILIFSYAIQFFVTPLSLVFPALEKVKTISIWQTGYFLLTVTLFLFTFLPVNQFLMLFTAFDVVAYFVYLVLILRTAAKYDSSLISAGK